MENVYVISKLQNKLCGFLFEEGKLNQIKCYEEESILGNVYVGRVSNIVPNIKAAFVDIQKGETCYLPLEDYRGDKPLKIGDEIIVQVAKDKIKTKQAALTCNISITGDTVVVQTDGVIGISSKIKAEAERNRYKELLQGVIVNQFEKKCLEHEYGVILRTKATEVSEEIVIEETIKLLCKLDEILYRAKYSTLYSKLLSKESELIADVRGYNLVGKTKVITDCQEVFDECTQQDNLAIELYQEKNLSLASAYNLTKLMERATQERVYLKSGAYLVIEPTEAMIVIDVNTGKAIKGKDSETAFYKINVEAAVEIARQMRLRNLSGIIMVDFINMKEDKNNTCLLQEFKKAVEKDPIQTTVVDMTRLGLVEVTRKKVRKPLYESMK